MFNLQRKLSYYIRIVELFVAILLPLLILVIIADQQLRFGLLNVIPTCHWYDVMCWLPVVLLLVRDMIPGLVTLCALGFLSADFVKAVYGLKTRSQGFDSVKRWLFGTSGFRPFLRVAGGKLEVDDKNPLVRTGGPCGLIVYNDSAAILEKAGRLTRVVKNGFPKLDPFEKIWDVVDLRPHRWVYDVSAMSKDGIPVTCQADVTLQIDDGGQAPSQDEPYPATEQAILLAATRKFIREASRSEDDQKMDWAGRAIVGATEGALRTILATYLLDQFMGPDEVNRNHYRSQIRSTLEVELRKQFPDIGVRLIKVELGNIMVEDEVAQQQIEAWQNLWKRWTKEREAEGEAERLQSVEAAKAQAQADMVVSITQAFQSSAAADASIPSQLVLLRMFEVLKRAPYDPQTGMLFLPAEIMRTWQMIQEIALGRQALLADSQPLSRDQIIKRNVLARLHIDKDLNTFGEAEQHELVQSIARRLRISESDIELVCVTSGRVIVVLEMPDEAALRLHEMQLKDNPFMKEIKVVRIDFRPSLVSSDVPSPLASPPLYLDARMIGATSDQTSSGQAEFAKLRQILNNYYNETELRDLFFDLGVEYQGLPGDSRADMSREIVSYCKRHGRIQALVDIIGESHPNALWQDSPQSNETLPRYPTALLPRSSDRHLTE